MKISFVGQNELGFACLSGLLEKGILPKFIVTRLDNDYANAVDQLAKQYELKIFKTADINKALEIKEAFDQYEIEVAFCCAWANRIRKNLLGLPKRGWVNFHPSNLPQYRGSSPISWCIINGERLFGCTAHMMDDSFDTGKIISTRQFEVSEREDAKSLRAKCAEAIRLLAPQVFIIMSENPDFAGFPQDETISSYYPPRNNHFVIDIHRQNLLEIDRHIRALTPYPCAVLPYEGKEYRIVKASLQSGQSDRKELRLEDDKLQVIFPEGKLVIEEILIDKQPNADYISYINLNR